ncbi:MAG: MarR family transcriptional regulator [Erysipelotrichaceae bacterium]|nr:MarR family transcriptional regulator [Erysipelotrichaceae bacterium]
MDRQDEEVMLRFRNAYAYFIRQLDENARKYGLTGVQWMIVSEVGLNSHITMHDLSEKLNLSKANLSAIIKRLQNNNVVTKERSTLDQRYVYIQLTEKGNKIFHHIEEDMKNHYPIWQKLDENDKDKILSALKALEKLIDKYEEKDNQESK